MSFFMREHKYKLIFVKICIVDEININKKKATVNKENVVLRTAQ